MGLGDFPSRGKSSIYSGDGETRVPKTIRDEEDPPWIKGDSLQWISRPEEDFVRVYNGGQKEANDSE